LRRFDPSWPIAYAGAALLLSGLAYAFEPDLTLRQLNHRAFTPSEGAPSDVYAVAQTPDGTLWLGGPGGLVRFDGVRFVPYPSASDQPLPSADVAALLAAPDGGLWISYRPSGVSLLKGGHVINYGEAEGLSQGTVAQFAVDRAGSVWAVPRTAVARFNGDRWETVAGEETVGNPYGVVIDPAGSVWIAGTKGLFVQHPGTKEFHRLDDRNYQSPWGHPLALAKDGRIWGAFVGGLTYVDAGSGEPKVLTVPESSTLGAPLMADAAGNLWAAVPAADALVRVSRRQLSETNSKFEISDTERLGDTAGFQERVLAFLPDRENNVWVGTRFSLHRFSHSNVLREIAHPCRADYAASGPMAAGDDGDLWIACAEDGGSFVLQVRQGVVLSRQPAPAFMVAYRDPQHTVWFGGLGELAHLDTDGKLVTNPLPEVLRGRPLHALVRDNDGGLWLSETRRSTYRLINGEVVENGNLPGLPRTWAVVATRDDDGTLWFGYVDGRLASVSARTVRLFGAATGLNLGTITSILADGREVWVGGELGFGRLVGENFTVIQDTTGSDLRGVSGIVRARNGDMWLSGALGVVHISREQIDRVIFDSAHRVKCEIFNYLDGIPGMAMKLGPLPSAVETADDRLWFAMSTGIVSIDATHITRNTLIPPVTIWALTADGRRYPNFTGDARLPVHTTNLQIEYSAGSLTIPERVRFRYRLVGLDKDWQDVGTRREARYTNLGPGRYTFKVIAANNDGVWNLTGASIGFTIAPAFYQTIWFYALCGIATVAALGALHRLRLRNVASQVRERLETRLAERERIARELHDTLLQGMQGLIWRFQAATDQIPPDQPARTLMEDSLDRADQLLGESRDRVKDLRPTERAMPDLGHVLAAECEQLAQLHPARFKVSVQGLRQDLHPIVREEGFLIAREALTNAFQHAAAADIEVEVTFGDSALQVRVRDDGQGVGAAVLNEGGRPGHFGLLGMRERAKRLGAHLTIWSSPGVGTEIDLRVPARVAYKRREARGSRRWRAKFGMRSRQAEPTYDSSERQS
jgi:signal transduction histidine kinase/ligand-binding sensor domain-containing protein